MSAITIHTALMSPLEALREELERIGIECGQLDRHDATSFACSSVIHLNDWLNGQGPTGSTALRDIEVQGRFQCDDLPTEEGFIGFFIVGSGQEEWQGELFHSVAQAVEHIEALDNRRRREMGAASRYEPAPAA